MFCHKTRHGWTDLDEFCDLVPGHSCEPVSSDLQLQFRRSMPRGLLPGEEQGDTTPIHMLQCKGGLEHLGEEKDARTILLTMRFEKSKGSHGRRLAKSESNEDSSSKNEKGTTTKSDEENVETSAPNSSEEALVEKKSPQELTDKVIKQDNLNAYRAHILGAWDVSNPNNPTAGNMKPHPENLLNPVFLSKKNFFFEIFFKNYQMTAGNMESFCSSNCNPFPYYKTILDPILAQKDLEEYQENHSLNVRNLATATMKRNEICDNVIARQWRYSFAENAAMFTMPLLFR